MAAVFVASFALAALLHRFTAVALVLCGVAAATLVVAVIGANVRSPLQRRAGPGGVVSEHRHLRSGPVKRPRGR
jgi:hypothetical protein